MSQKNWNVPWTTEEIIENADNWSLAGDAALLNTIKDFAEKMFTKSQNISDNIDKLLHSVDELQLKLNITQNEFNSLKNSQFIENRVQEEDETLETVDEKQSPVVLSEENQRKIINDSIRVGIEMLEKYYDNVEISISDSEGESERSFILKPKDPYADRPLPPIIGSEEWYGKWHLNDSSSDSECDKVSETYSDTDTDEDIPKDLNKISESSSELDFSSVTSEGRPVGSSTFNDSSKKTDFVPSSEESDGNLETQSTKTPLASKSFAEQLSAKLMGSNVIRKDEEPPEEEVNRKPIKKVQNNNYVDPLFSDEPPPLDDGLDKSSVKNIYSDLFSGGQGLFDDSEDDDFWEPKKPTMKQLPDVEEKTTTIIPKVDNLFDNRDENVDDLFSNIPKKPSDSNFYNRIESKTIAEKETKDDVKSLFEHVEEEDDNDLFSTAPKKPTIATPQSDISGKNTLSTSGRKKPIGGVSVFGSADLFANKNIKDILGDKNSIKSPLKSDKPNIISEKPKLLPRSSDIDSKSSAESSHKNNEHEQEFDKITNSDVVISETKKTKHIFNDNDYDDVDFIPPKSQNDAAASRTKKINLFDDNDDDENDLFSGISSKKEVPSKQPDDIFENLFSSTSNSSHQIKKSFDKKSNLFDDDDLAKYDLFADIPKEDDFDDLFSSTSKIINESKIFINETTNISKQANIKNTDDIITEYSNNNDEIVKQQENTVNKNEEILDNDENKNNSEEQITPAKAVDENKICFQEETVPEDIFFDGISSNMKDSEAKPVNDSKTDELFSSDLETKTEKHSTVMEDSQSSISNIKQSATEISGNFQPKNNDKDDVIDNRIPTDINIPEDNLFSSNPTTAQHQGLFDDLQTGIFDILPNLSNSSKDQLSHVDKKEPKHIISLFDSTPPPDDEEDWDTKSDNLSDNDDLFSYTVIKNQPTSIFDSEPPSLEPQPPQKEDHNLNREHLDQPPPLNLPPKPLFPTSNDSTIDNDIPNVSSPCDLPIVPDSAPEISSGSLNKLKLNLNINVKALRPGCAPLKFKEQTQQKETITTVKSTILSDNDEFVDGNTSSSGSVPSRAPAKNIEKGVSFDDDLGSHEVLHSYTKDRAKIPLKRKPSTKRGRQETIRRTATADPIDIESSEVKVTEIHKAVSEGMLPVDSKSKEHIENVVGFFDTHNDSQRKINDDPLNNISSIAIDREETSEVAASTNKDPLSPLFSSSEDKDIKDERPSFSPKDMDIKTKDDKLPVSSNIFKDIDKEDIFANKPHQNKKKDEATNKTKISLFESSDSDDDLFGKTDMKKSKTSANVTKSVKKKGLFDDSSSEDDLFGSKKN